jgi:hypothetical protein
MSAPTASCLPSTKANEAVKYVISMVLDFDLVDDCPLWLAVIHDAMDKSRVNIYNQWLWLTPDDILALEYHPRPEQAENSSSLPGVPYPCHKVQGNVF